MEKPEFCSDCKYAKVEVDELGLLIYCQNLVYKAKPGWNNFPTVRKITAFACSKAEPREKKEAK